MIAVSTTDRHGAELIDLFESEKVYYGKNPEPCGAIAIVIIGVPGQPDYNAKRDELAKLISGVINSAHVEPHEKQQCSCSCPMGFHTRTCASHHDR